MGGSIFLGRYQSIRLLGEGGMGRVYLARQRDVGRLVVVKVLHERHVGVRQYHEAFKREIDFMARFRHPGAVELYEASLTDSNGPCAVMEYVDGLPLDDLLERQGRLRPERVGRLLGRLCSVLQAAHDQGIIHRDLKPGNILVVDADSVAETIKLLDFGLARLALAPSAGPFIAMEKFTSSGANAAVGTPEYSCPEQFRGDEVDQRGDLYSVGIILYELLTGRRPFSGKTISELVTAHCRLLPPPFGSIAGAHGISPAVEAVVQACLAKDRVDRPQSARELALRFEKALGQPIWSEEAALPQRPVAVETADPRAEVTDPNAVVYRLQAWMPERIASVKLRGFLNECGGEVVESVPGLIRVRLPRPRVVKQTRSGFWSRLGLGKKAEAVATADPVEMDVYMDKPNPEQPNNLLITVRLRQGGEGRSEADADWPSWCDQVQIALSAYLMAKRCG